MTEALNESVSSNAEDTFYQFIDKYDMDEAGIGDAYRDFPVITFTDIDSTAKRLGINVSSNHEIYQAIKLTGMCFAKYLENKKIGEVTMNYTKARGFKINVNGKKYITLRAPSDIKGWLSDMESDEEVEGSWDVDEEFPVELA